MTVLKNLFSLILLFSFSTTIYAGNPLEDAWKKLDETEIFEAIKLFEKAAKKDAYKEEASLMLALLYQRVDRVEESTKRFADYYKVAEDPIPTSYALMYSECVIGPQGYKKEYNEKIHDMLLDDPRSKGKTRTSLLYNKSWDADIKRQPERADECTTLINELIDWAYLGPFDNVMNNGFDKDYNVIDYPKDNAEFKTRYGATVSWFHSEIDKQEGYRTINSIFRDSEMQAYAQTFVESEEEQEVILHLGYSGSIKLWLNDHEVYSERAVRAEVVRERQRKDKEQRER